MIQFRLYFNKDKETAWLNEMAAKGYAMTGFCLGFFQFEKTEPGKYQYQIDFGHKLFAVSNDYREFMTETGVEIVQTWGYWIILRKLASEGNFQLYTDVDSSIEHYSKILKMFKIVTIIEIFCFLIEVFLIDDTAAAIPCMIIIGALIFVLMKATIQTKQTISKLKERKGDFSSTFEAEHSKVSPLLPVGMLINLCAMVLQESITPAAVHVLQIIAILLMLLGLYRSGNIFRK